MSKDFFSRLALENPTWRIIFITIAILGSEQQLKKLTLEKHDGYPKDDMADEL